MQLNKLCDIKAYDLMKNISGSLLITRPILILDFCSLVQKACRLYQSNEFPKIII